MSTTPATNKKVSFRHGQCSAFWQPFSSWRVENLLPCLRQRKDFSTGSTRISRRSRRLMDFMQSQMHALIARLGSRTAFTAMSRRNRATKVWIGLATDQNRIDRWLRTPRRTFRAYSKPPMQARSSVLRLLFVSEGSIVMFARLHNRSSAYWRPAHQLVLDFLPKTNLNKLLILVKPHRWLVNPSSF